MAFQRTVVVVVDDNDDDDDDDDDDDVVGGKGGRSVNCEERVCMCVCVREGVQMRMRVGE